MDIKVLLVYAVLANELQTNGVHAFSLITKLVNEISLFQAPHELLSNINR
jgi:hypothetical protein